MLQQTMTAATRRLGASLESWCQRSIGGAFSHWKHLTFASVLDLPHQMPDAVKAESKGDPMYIAELEATVRRLQDELLSTRFSAGTRRLYSVLTALSARTVSGSFRTWKINCGMQSVAAAMGDFQGLLEQQRAADGRVQDLEQTLMNAQMSAGMQLVNKVLDGWMQRTVGGAFQRWRREVLIQKLIERKEAELGITIGNLTDLQSQLDSSHSQLQSVRTFIHCLISIEDSDTPSCITCVCVWVMLATGPARQRFQTHCEHAHAVGAQVTGRRLSSVETKY